MGNGQQSLKGSNSNQYQLISQSSDTIVGQPSIVKSNKTQVELQEYIVKNNDLQIKDDVKLYKLRSSSYSKNIAVVFTHQLLNEKQKVFKVRTQKMKGRLNIINDLTYLEGLCILESALNGFAQLVFHAKKPFMITDKMIAVNEFPLVRVWLNQNFAQNKIMTSGGPNSSQKAMIDQIICAIGDHVVLADRQKFYTHRLGLNKFQKIMAAKNSLSCYLHQTNRKAILKQMIIKKEQQSKKQLEIENVKKIEKKQNLESNTKIDFGSPSFTSKKKQFVTPSNIQLNGSQKKMQMISQKKSIFKNSHRQENGNANLDRTPKKSQYITFSPLKNPQKENITTNSRNQRSKSKDLSRSGIKLESTLKSLQKRKDRIHTESQELSKSRNMQKYTVTPTTTKQYTIKTPKITFQDAKSLTPKAKVYQNIKDDSQMNLNRPKLNQQVIKSQFYYYQRPSQNLIQVNRQNQNYFKRSPRTSEYVRPQPHIESTSPVWQKYSAIQPNNFHDPHRNGILYRPH